MSAEGDHIKQLALLHKFQVLVRKHYQVMICPLHIPPHSDHDHLAQYRKPGLKCALQHEWEPDITWEGPMVIMENLNS